MESISNATASLLETSPHTFTAEASELGLRPGIWPQELPVAPDFGNGQPLKRSITKMRDGEIESVTYLQRFGCISLVVFND